MVTIQNKLKKHLLIKKQVKIYLVYNRNLWSDIQNCDFAVWNYLFGAVKLTKFANPDKKSCSGYVIGFDARQSFFANNNTRSAKLEIKMTDVKLLKY